MSFSRSQVGVCILFSCWGSPRACSISQCLFSNLAQVLWALQRDYIYPSYFCWITLSPSPGIYNTDFGTWEQYGSCLKVRVGLLLLKTLCLLHPQYLLQLRSLCPQHPFSHFHLEHFHSTLQCWGGHRDEGFNSALRSNILLCQFPLSHCMEAAEVSLWILGCIPWPCRKGRGMLSSFSY